MEISVKHILCFGDSNTHGYIPGGGRYDDDTRWTGILRQLLGSDYMIIEEGLNGRTSSFDDPFEPFKNGMDYIVPCLETHKPLDLTILMLGSNDMKQRFSPSTQKIAASLECLARLILDVSESPVLLVSPILLGDNMANSDFAPSFSPEAVSISHELGAALKDVADKLQIPFMNAADYAAPSPIDSLHLTAEGHMALAQAFYKKVLEII